MPVPAHSEQSELNGDAPPQRTGFGGRQFSEPQHVLTRLVHAPHVLAHTSAIVTPEGGVHEMPAAEYIPAAKSLIVVAHMDATVMPA